MSNLVFPSALAGLDVKITREVQPRVYVAEATGRREPNRSTWEDAPLVSYKLDFQVLRADSSITGRAREWQRLLGHLARHFGQLDSFLFSDPDDSSVTDHGFALGDGIASSFQLQRALAGDVTDAAGIVYRAATKPFTNLIYNSSFEVDTDGDGLSDKWGIYNNASATEPAYASRVPGANGGWAQRIAWGTNATNSKGVYQTGVIGGPATTWVTGKWFTVSCYARASGSNVGKFIGLGWNTAPSTTLAIANPPLSSSWQRYVFQVFWNVGAALQTGQVYYSISNNAAGGLAASGTFGTLDFDLAQVTAGQWGAQDLPPVETPVGAAGTDVPAYWPITSDGFEPIYDLAAPPTIYRDGDWQGRRALYPFPRTNLLASSELIDTWPTKIFASATANATTAPDGATTADLINEGNPPLAPTLNSATPSASGGSLASATYYVQVAALTATDEGMPSGELSAVVVGPTGSIALAWTAPGSGATPTGYRIYIGTAAGLENVWQLPGNVTSATLTVSTGTAGTPRTTTATQHYYSQNLAAEASGELRCYSIFLKANTLPNILWGVTVNSSGVYFDLGAGTINSNVGADTLASGVIPYPNGWYRLWFTRRAGPSLASAACIAGRTATYLSTYTGTGRSFYAWGAMSEQVSDLSGPTPYIATPAGSATVPAEYTIDAAGKVTLPAPLVAGAFLSWDGSFYRRVRFAQDSLSTDRIAAAMYEARGVSLVTVNP